MDQKRQIKTICRQKNTIKNHKNQFIFSKKKIENQYNFYRSLVSKKLISRNYMTRPCDDLYNSDYDIDDSCDIYDTMT